MMQNFSMSAEEASALTMTKKEAKLAAKAAVEPLSQIMIQRLTHELSAAGGRQPLGKLCGKFKGLKRVQLEGIFELTEIGAQGLVEVRLPGMPPPLGVVTDGGEVVSQDLVLPPLSP